MYECMLYVYARAHVRTFRFSWIYYVDDVINEFSVLVSFQDQRPPVCKLMMRRLIYGRSLNLSTLVRGSRGIDYE